MGLLIVYKVVLVPLIKKTVVSSSDDDVFNEYNREEDYIFVDSLVVFLVVIPADVVMRKVVAF